VLGLGWCTLSAVLRLALLKNAPSRLFRLFSHKKTRPFDHGGLFSAKKRALLAPPRVSRRKRAPFRLFHLFSHKKTRPFDHGGLFSAKKRAFSASLRLVLPTSGLF
jgi:hypothetical protein